MPRGKSAKSTPTKARVIFSDNSPTNTTPGINSSYTEKTPLTSAQKHAGRSKAFGKNQPHLQQEVVGHPNRKERHPKRSKGLRD